MTSELMVITVEFVCFLIDYGNKILGRICWSTQCWAQYLREVWFLDRELKGEKR